MAKFAASVDVAEESPSGASLRGSHRLQAVTTCERMWFWRYWRNIRLAKSQDTKWRREGSMFHACFQYWYASQMASPPAWYHPDGLYPHLLQLAEGLYPGDREESLARIAQGFTRYREYYEEDAATFKVVAIEEEYEATVGELDPGGPDETLDDEVVTCRPDLIYERPDGTLTCLDFKTIGRSGINHKTGRLPRWSRDGEWSLALQVLLNLKILRLRLGASRVREFEIQRMTRQPPWDFDRNALTIPQLEYQNFGRSIREYVRREREIVARAEAGIEPYAFYACQGRYGACDYRKVCTTRTQEDRDAQLKSGDFEWATEEELRTSRQRLRIVR